jgi:hypothetical protein
MSGLTNSICTTNKNIEIQAGTGSISIGTLAAANAITLGNTTGSSSITMNVGSGGITIPSFSSYGVVGVSNAGLISDIAAGTSGYVLTSNGTGSLPSWQAASSGGGITWNNVTGSSQTMAVNNGYIDNGSGTPTVYTLPATAAVGSQLAVQGSASGLWRISQNAGQQIIFNGGSTTAGTGGYVLATSQYDSLYLLCIVADTTFVATSGFGNYNVV